MLLESAEVIAIFETACRRAQKVFETSGRKEYDAGRLEGLRQARCIVEGLVSANGECSDEPIALEKSE